MTPATLLRIAFTAIRRNLMRSTLTVLGIVIGIAAVISLTSLAEGARRAVDAQISAMGDNTLTLFGGSTAKGGFRGAGSTNLLTVADADAIASQCDNVAAVSPQVETDVLLVAGDRNWTTEVQGINTDFLAISRWPVESGALFSQADVRAQAKVCVLGKTVATNLFGDASPLGQIIRVRKIPFTVIGVLSARGMKSNGNDQDDKAFIPYTTAMTRIIGTQYVRMILVAATDRSTVDAAADEVRTLIRVRHKLQPRDPDDFSIRRQSDVAAAADASAAVMSSLLTAVAAVSLLVGGIGIMNIMLVSVTERTREIGLRMAVGAKPLDILWQFLSEALVLSLFGGIIGIACGFGLAAFIGYFTHWDTVILPSAVSTGVLVSAAIGVIFGFYPARRASLLDPIIALHSE